MIGQGEGHPTTATLFQALDGMKVWAGEPFVLGTGLYGNGRGGIWVDYGFELGADCHARKEPRWGKLTTNLPDCAQRPDETFLVTRPTTARRVFRYIKRVGIWEAIADGFPAIDTALVRFSVCDKHGDVGYAVTCERCRQLADERYERALEEHRARLVLKEMQEGVDTTLWEGIPF